MKYLAWLGVASIVLIVTSCAPAAYTSGTPQSSPYSSATNFNGDWHLVSGRSSTGRDWLDEQNRFNSDSGTNEWGPNGSTSDDTNDRYRYGAWFLPDEFRIEGDRQNLQIEDPSGNVIASVDMGGDYRSGSYDQNSSRRGVQARWISRRSFEVERVGRSGRRITQTFTLQNRGQQLVVATQVQGDGGTRSFTRVYAHA